MLALKFHSSALACERRGPRRLLGFPFAVLLSLWLLRLSTPANPLEVVGRVAESSGQVAPDPHCIDLADRVKTLSQRIPARRVLR